MNLCKDLIPKGRMLSFLNFSLMSKQDYKDLGDFFELNISKEKKDKILFLAYNEYIPFPISNVTEEKIDQILTADSETEYAILSIDKIFNSPMAHIRNSFYREYCAVIAPEEYHDSPTISAKLLRKLLYIDLTFTDEEKVLLHNLSINAPYTIKMVRIADKKSDVETNITTFNNIARLVSIKDETIMSILNKIMMGTINY